MNKVKIRILDEINVVVLGLERRHYDHFYKKFGINSPGYFFKPAYQTGKWDGKNRFFSKNGKTSINLLSDIIPDLTAFKYKIELDDQRSNAALHVPSIDVSYFEHFGITLGDHQVEAANAVFEARGGIVLAGTGAGKSILTAAICDAYEKNCGLTSLVIVPSADLVTQTADALKIFDLDVGVYSGTKKDINHRHVVSTWQALQNSPKIVSMFNMVIVDECHGVKGNVLKSLLVEHATTALVRVGLTGTLPKEESDAMSVRYVLGEVVYEVPASELIDKGWLAKMNLRTYILEEDFEEKWEEYKIHYPQEAAQLTYSKFKKTYFPDYTSEKAYLQKNKDRNAFIASLVDKATELHGNSFVLTTGVANGKRLAEMIPNAIFVYGQDESAVRQEIYKQFETNNDITVVSSYQLASTGLNIPRIFNLFLLDPGKSFIKIIQSIGRGLRKAHDKDSINIWDFSSDLKYSSMHYKQRIKYYKEQNYPYVVQKVKYTEFLDN